MTRVEELRKNLISELGALQMTMFGTDTSDEEVDALIHAVRQEEGERRTRCNAYARGDNGPSGVV